MPTGYTHKIKDGQSFEDFVWGCARAFGALVTMRDEPLDAPIPDKFTVDSYEVEHLAAAKAKLAKLESYKIGDWEGENEADYQKRLAAYQELSDKRNAEDVAYRAMLARVSAWQPPTSEHVGLKDFMDQQIRDSIRFDCGYSPDIPEPMTVEEYRDKTLEYARKEVKRAEEYLNEEIDRVNTRNEWLQKLRESLGGNNG